MFGPSVFKRVYSTVRLALRHRVLLGFVLSVVVASRLALAGSPGPRIPIPAEGIPSRPRGPAPMVLTQHNDNARTGANLNETILTTANVNAQQFGKLFTRTVVGQIYAQPLYVPGIVIPNQGTHNVVFVASMHNNVYAFDADDPALSAPLWQRNLGPTAPATDFGQLYSPYTDIVGEVGVVSTPVIDVNTNTLYVVALTRTVSIVNSSVITTYAHSLHALNIATGAEKFGGPVIIRGSVPGSGSGGTSVSFDSSIQLQRPGLLLANGVIVITFGSYGDTGPYHGWLMGYDAQTLHQRYIFNASPNSANGSAIWQSGQGVSADNAGNLYFITGNGIYNDAIHEFGDSFIKLSPTSTTTGVLPVADWFTPYNQEDLYIGDLDLGSAGPLLIPGTNFLVSGGKQGILYLMNRSNMGRFNPGGPDLIAQSFLVYNGGIFGSPIYWSGPEGPLVYLWMTFYKLAAFSLVVTDTAHVSIRTVPVATGSTLATFPGSMLSLSANGNISGTGIVWASQPLNAAQPVVPGILHAYDASNVSVELWNSTLNPADNVGNFAKFNNPTIANGKVYLATFSNQLVVYGLRRKLLSLPYVTR